MLFGTLIGVALFAEQAGEKLSCEKNAFLSFSSASTARLKLCVFRENFSLAFSTVMSLNRQHCSTLVKG
jgi:hypothetical protein